MLLLFPTTELPLTDEVLLAASPHADLPALAALVPADAAVLAAALVAVVAALGHTVGADLGQVLGGTWADHTAHRQSTHKLIMQVPHLYHTPLPHFLSPLAKT